jgi:2-iminobutanoate/2-iminopropanoate deaminase
MSKEVVQTPNAPSAIGPYSQAIIANGFVYTAGQLGVVPSTGKLIEGDVKAQTRQALENLTAILSAAGTSLGNAVKTTVFLANMDDFAAMNSVYAEYFISNPPARSTIQVAKLPLAGLVEIEVVAMLLP